MIQTLGPDNGHAGFSLLDVRAAGDLSAVGHLFTMKVTSWSMFPTILKNDVLTIGPADQVLLGDIVIFQQIGALVCHRVTSVGAGGEIHTKGDQADRPDPPIPQRDILAKVTTIMRGGQNVSSAPFRDPPIASLVRMRTDLLLTSVRERLLSLALRTAAWCKRVPWIRDAVAVVLRKLVRFSVGIRAPIRSIKAYRFMPLGGWHGGHGEAFPAECRTADELVFMAHLGGHPLATFDPASGKVSIRRIAAGLGLEESLHNLNHRLQSARASTRS